MQAVEDGLPQVHVSGPQSDEEEEYHSLKSQNSLHQVGHEVFIVTA